MTREVLTIRDLTFGYGHTPILSKCSLSVNAGEVVALLGRSGAGKSTLLKCITLLCAPHSGRLSLCGVPYFRNGAALHKPYEVRRRIGLVFQSLNLFPVLSVKMNLTLGLTRVLGLDRREADKRAIEVLDALGLELLADRRPAQLSGGQAQRVALARAFVLQPQVLLLDEVTAALDPESIEVVTKTIRSVRELSQNQNMAILVVTHLLPFAQSFADRICFLDQGEICESHSADQFVQRAKNKTAVSFIKSARSEWIG